MLRCFVEPPCFQNADLLRWPYLGEDQLPGADVYSVMSTCRILHTKYHKFERMDRSCLMLVNSFFFACGYL